VAAEGGDVVAYDIDAGYLAVLDLGDSRLADTEDVGQIRLGDAGGLADLGDLEPPDVRLALFACGGLTGGALGGLGLPGL
jgi:hypothetical protein